MTRSRTTEEPRPRPYAALGRRLVALREARRMVQREVARLVPMSYGQYAGMERGERRAGVDLLRRLAVVLGTTYEDLGALAGFVREVQGDETTIAVRADGALPMRQRLANLPARWVRMLIAQYDAASAADDAILTDPSGGAAPGAGQSAR